MTQTVATTDLVGVKCPGCQTIAQVPKGQRRVVCPSCCEAIVFRKCPTTGTTSTVLERWATYTHPGCSTAHRVALGNAASSTKGPAKPKKPWIGLLILALLGVGLAFVTVHRYVQKPIAACDGSTMSRGDLCQITGGSDDGTYSYDEMLDRDKTTLVDLVGLLLLSAAFVAPGVKHLAGRRRQGSKSPSGP